MPEFDDPVLVGHAESGGRQGDGLPARVQSVLDHLATHIFSAYHFGDLLAAFYGTNSQPSNLEFKKYPKKYPVIPVYQVGRYLIIRMISMYCRC